MLSEVEGSHLNTASYFIQITCGKKQTDYNYNRAQNQKEDSGKNVVVRM